MTGECLKPHLVNASYLIHSFVSVLRWSCASDAGPRFIYVTPTQRPMFARPPCVWHTYVFTSSSHTAVQCCPLANDIQFLVIWQQRLKIETGVIINNLLHIIDNMSYTFNNTIFFHRIFSIVDKLLKRVLGK